MDDSLTTKSGNGVLRTLMSTLNPSAMMGRWGLANWAGMSFGWRRDTYVSLGYQRLLRPLDYRARYKRGGIAARIVEAMPQSAWRGGGEITEDTDPNKFTDFEQAFIDLNTRLSVWQMFQRADILAGIGRYSILVIGGPGKLDSPLPKCGPDDIRYLMAYAEDEAIINEYDTDTTSERFSLPLSYNLQRANTQWSPNARPPAVNSTVHFSRVIHIADNMLDDPVFGQPRLERVWNLLDDLDKVIGGGAESFWKRADGGTQFKIDPELAYDPDPAKALQQRQEMETKFDEFTHDLRKNLVTRGIDINRMGSDVADLRGPAAAIMDQISATIGMPQRILMGSEIGKLASSRDKSNWDDQIQDRRVFFCAPVVVRPFIDRLIQVGALPTPKEYFVSWPETDELDQGQRVTAAVQISTMNKNSGTTVVTPSEIRTIYLGLDVMTPEQLVEVKAIEEKQQEQAQAKSPFGGGATEGGNRPPRPVPGAAKVTEESNSLVAAAHELDVRALESALLDDDLTLANTIVARALGGPGSGRYPAGSRGQSEETKRSQTLRHDTNPTERAQRAAAAHNPFTKEKEAWATKNEDKVVQMIGGKGTPDNQPFDVTLKTGGKLHGVEVKTMLDNKASKITMRKEARERKEEWSKNNKAAMHTVVIDDREKFGKVPGSGHRVYYAPGIGSFRLNTMTPVKNEVHLRQLIRQNS